MIEYREKFYVATNDLKDRVPVALKQIASGAVAIIFAIGLFLIVLILLDRLCTKSRLASTTAASPPDVRQGYALPGNLSF